MDGEPEAKRACPSPTGDTGGEETASPHALSSPIVADVAILHMEQIEDAGNGSASLITGPFAMELACAITGLTENPFGRLRELASKKELLMVPREFFVKHCPGVEEDEMNLDDFIGAVSKQKVAHVINAFGGEMSGHYRIKDLIVILSIPTFG